MARSVPVPKEGKDICVPDYPGEGDNNINAGFAKVVHVYPDVTSGTTVHLIEVAEVPGRRMKWEGFLAPLQHGLRKKLGDHRAYCGPPVRKESNDWRDYNDPQ